MSNKYVDQTGLARILANLKANFARSSHTHAAGDVTSGTFAAARLPAATTSAQGAMSAADKTKLNGFENASKYYKKGADQIHRNSGDSSAEPQHASFANGKGTIEYEFIKAVAGIGDWFYSLHQNSDYIITCNYSGNNGTKGNFNLSTLFSPSAASTTLLDVDAIAETPFVLQIEKSASGAMTATDVVHLELWGHRLDGTPAALTDYKVELLTTGTSSGSGDFSWQTVYERHNVSDKINGLTICLNPSSTYPYLYFKGLRFTIYGATPGSTSSDAWNYNCIDLSLFRLMDQRPAFSAARAIGALDLNGGTVYGAVEMRSNLNVKGTLTANLTGNVTGMATALSGVSGRQSSANNLHNNNQRIRALLATSSMTTGKPPYDAHILHFNWDNGASTTGTLDAQLALAMNPPGLYIRTQINGTWTDWIKIYDNYTGLAASDIPSLDASKITSGTLDSDRIPALTDAEVLEILEPSLTPRE